jgi:hypothetical protein
LAEDICTRLKRLKNAAVARDRRMLEVTMVRKGEVHLMAPGLFSEDWPKPIISNAIDTIARDFAGSLAPLPALNCSSRAMRTDGDKRKAMKKNKIGSYYWKIADLAGRMLTAADWYLSYGFLVAYVEPDFDCQFPMIRFENPMGTYYELDRFGNCNFLAKTWTEKAWQIAEKFPELADQIMPTDRWGKRHPDTDLQVARICDATNWSLVLPSVNEPGTTRTRQILLSQYAHGMDKPPVVIAERPSIGDDPMGQFDQVIWTWLARARMALMQLDAAHKAVNSPTVLPRDAVEFPVGPDAVIQTDNPGAVRKVSLELPQSAFAITEQLDQEIREGSRYPQARTGSTDASVITGRGIQALMGGFSTQIQEAQTILGTLLRRITSVAFELDVKLWPTQRKRIQGNQAGEPYDLFYSPKTDLGDNLSCDVTYGYAAGLAPNQAIVMLLQLRGDELISRDTFRRQLPFDVDIDDEQRRIDVNRTEDAVMQGIFALLQSFGPMAAQGMDPTPVMQNAAKFIKLRQDGMSVADAVVEAFGQKADISGDASQSGSSPNDAGNGGGDAQNGVEGVNPNGLPTGVAPGQAGLPAGGRPDLEQMIAGIRGGRPVMDNTVNRRIPIGA